MSIDKVIASLPQKDASQRKVLRNNANNRLAANPENVDAQRLLEALDKFQSTNRKPASNYSGAIQWDAHGHAGTSFGKVDGGVVAKITKSQNHTADNEKIYSVEVLGNVLPEEPRYIKQARKAAEVEYLRVTHSGI